MSYDQFEDLRKRMLKMLRDMMIDADEMDAWLEGLLDDMELSLKPRELLNKRIDESSKGYLTPLISIHDLGDELLITIDIPGSDPNSISIELVPDKISIEAKIKEEIAREAFGQAYWAKKIHEYKGTYTLPANVDPRSAKINKKKGMLVIKVKKA
ncbi:MAG: Hsp20/alpha crystallin family protein [Caldisphaera sp.]|nr:Hsp20/alpha crystallin family protein [Caldisphaera sp.]PMP60260.1 MAG: hypothetical protein C0201_03095 [Caldisphaera sp.]PMP88666.1 MAG: hypothetical protein C0172_02010 [Caldisphaera sp.]